MRTDRPRRAGALRFIVVVPVMRHDARTQRCLDSCVRLSYEPKTICVVSDEPLELPADLDVVSFATRAGTLTSPAFKRDLASKMFPDADVYANLDDDAYAPPDWLDRAARVLGEHPHAAGAGGPGLAPPDESFWERVSSTVLQMGAGSGPLRFRFWPERARDCDDFPSHNLFVRRHWLEAVGGWSTNWNGGEDTALCARLAQNGGLIRYDPQLGAFHYRRAFFGGHLWQIFNVGRSRGCFVRAGAPRSRKLAFAGPPAIVLAVIALAVSPLLGVPAWIAVAVAATSFAALAVAGHPGPLDWRIRLIAPFALIAHHAAYAAGLFYGLVTGSRTVRRDPNIDAMTARRATEGS